MKKERKEYLDIIRSLKGDEEGRRKAADYVRDSDCDTYGYPAPFSFVPTFYNSKEISFMEKTVEMTHSVLSKAIKHYVEDPEYRKLFAFSEAVEKLILLPCGYEEQLPISRFDFFLSEDDFSFKFCEFNADGAAAMSRTQIGCEAVALSESFQKFTENHEVVPFEYFDTWVSAFLDTYNSDIHVAKSADKTDAEEGRYLPLMPNVLITDFKEAVTWSDVTRYLAAFEKAGVNARFVDLRDLSFDGEHLIDASDGMVFHAVYRRVTTSDIAKRYEDCKALIDAVAAEKIVLIGHFRTTVPHAKMINVALLDEQTKAILTAEEWAFVQEHVLPTYRLRHDTKGLDIAAIKADKDKWILKPEDDYDSHGIYAGGDLSQEEWEEKVESLIDKDYIVMEFYVPAKSEICLPIPAADDLKDDTYNSDKPAGLVSAIAYYADEAMKEDYGIKPWFSMTGTYSFNGKFGGFFSRMGQEFVISESHHGVSIPSFRLIGE